MMAKKCSRKMGTLKKAKERKFDNMLFALWYRP
jgi:hypothetical protein